MKKRGITLLLKKMPKWVHTVGKLLSENDYKKYEETIWFFAVIDFFSSMGIRLYAIFWAGTCTDWSAT